MAAPGPMAWELACSPLANCTGMGWPECLAFEWAARSSGSELGRVLVDWQVAPSASTAACDAHRPTFCRGRSRRGLKLAGAVGEGYPLLALPTSLTPADVEAALPNMTASARALLAREAAAGADAEQEAQQVALALFLMHCAALPASSLARRWRPLLQLLPRHFHTTLDLGEEAARTLGASRTLPRAARTLKRLRALYNRLFPALPAAHPSALPPAVTSFGLFRWAMDAVRSRAFAPPPPRGVAGGAPPAPSIALTPVADLINHAESSALGWRTDAGRLELLTPSPMPPGARVEFSYGAYGNGELLLRWGFTLPMASGGSSYEAHTHTLALGLPASGCAFANYSLRVLGVGVGRRRVTLRRAALSEATLNLARVATLTDDEMRTYDPWVCASASVAHERRALGAYARVVADLERRYVETTDAVRAAGGGPDRAARRRARAAEPAALLPAVLDAPTRPGAAPAAVAEALVAARELGRTRRLTVSANVSAGDCDCEPSAAEALSSARDVVDSELAVYAEQQSLPLGLRAWLGLFEPDPDTLAPAGVRRRASTGADYVDDVLRPLLGDAAMFGVRVGRALAKCPECDEPNGTRPFTAWPESQAGSARARRRVTAS